MKRGRDAAAGHHPRARGRIKSFKVQALSRNLLGVFSSELSHLCFFFSYIYQLFPRRVLHAFRLFDYTSWYYFAETRIFPLEQ